MKTLNDLLKEGTLSKRKFMVIVVKVEGCKAPEVIVNHRVNFEEKLTYYSKAYNDDLTLKANSKIRITDFDFCDEFTCD